MTPVTHDPNDLNKHWHSAQDTIFEVCPDELGRRQNILRLWDRGFAQNFDLASPQARAKNLVFYAILLIFNRFWSILADLGCFGHGYWCGMVRDWSGIDLGAILHLGNLPESQFLIKKYIFCHFLTSTFATKSHPFIFGPFCIFICIYAYTLCIRICMRIICTWICILFGTFKKRAKKQKTSRGWPSIVCSYGL